MFNIVNVGFYIVSAVVGISITYLVIHAAVTNGIVDAWHKIENEKNEKTRRLYDEK